MTVRVEKPSVNLREKLAELDKPTGIAGEAMLRADTVPDQAELLGYRQQNVIINGDMQIAQRGTSITNVFDAKFGACDRWHIIESGSAIATLSQETDAPNGFYKSLKVTPTTTDTAANNTDFFILTQTIEDHNVMHFNAGDSAAKGHTLSFWVKSNVTGKYTAELEYKDASLTYPKGYTINQADTWEKKCLYFPPQTSTAITADGGIGIKVFFWLMAGSNYNASPQKTTWSSSSTGRATNQVNVVNSTSNNFYITGVQLVAGNYPDGLPFEHRSYGEELALCQRYYYRIDGRSGYSILPTFAAYDANNAAGSIPFPVELRDRPTALEQSGTAGDYFLTDSSGAGQACTSVPTFGGSTHKKGASVVMTSTGNVSAGNASIPTMGANGYLAWSAEL